MRRGCPAPPRPRRVPRAAARRRRAGRSRRSAVGPTGPGSTPPPTGRPRAPSAAPEPGGPSGGRSPRPRRTSRSFVDGHVRTSGSGNLAGPLGFDDCPLSRPPTVTAPVELPADEAVCGDAHRRDPEVGQQGGADGPADDVPAAERAGRPVAVPVDPDGEGGAGLRRGGNGDGCRALDTGRRDPHGGRP